MTDRIKELIRALQGRVGADGDVQEHAKRASATKRGPGRRHSQGQQRSQARSDRPGMGAQWLGERTNSERNSERALKRQLGARQFKRMQREQRKASKQ